MGKGELPLRGNSPSDFIDTFFAGMTRERIPASLSRLGMTGL